jgi:hypothetical protein
MKISFCDIFFKFLGLGLGMRIGRVVIIIIKQIKINIIKIIARYVLELRSR